VKTDESIAHRKGRAETDSEFLKFVRLVLEDPTITVISPAISKRVHARVIQARREYEDLLEVNGLGPKGIVIPRSAKQTDASLQGGKK